MRFYIRRENVIDSLIDLGITGDVEQKLRKALQGAEIEIRHVPRQHYLFTFSIDGVGPLEAYTERAHPSKRYDYVLYYITPRFAKRTRGTGQNTAKPHTPGSSRDRLRNNYLDRVKRSRVHPVANDFNLDLDESPVTYVYVTTKGTMAMQCKKGEATQRLKEILLIQGVFVDTISVWLPYEKPGLVGELLKKASCG